MCGDTRIFTSELKVELLNLALIKIDIVKLFIRFPSEVAKAVKTDSSHLVHSND